MSLQSRRCITAADLEPSNDPRCYLFLSKAYLSSPDSRRKTRNPTDSGVTQTLNLRTQWRSIIYALGIWKGRRLEGHEVDFQTVEVASAKIDCKLDANIAGRASAAGNPLYRSASSTTRRCRSTRRTLQLSPNLPDAHFRLGRYYLHAGEKEKAQNEFDVFNKLKVPSTKRKRDKARADVQLFIVCFSKHSPSTTLIRSSLSAYAGHRRGSIGVLVRQQSIDAK